MLSVCLYFDIAGGWFRGDSVPGNLFQRAFSVVVYIHLRKREMEELKGLLILYIVSSTWGKNCVMEVKHTPCAAAMERMENTLMVIKSDPLGWSVRHLVTEAY